jgi:23S rRNA (cytidine1920-2'-O)/16S rRNA (cytidine1409-2'-O)-methyltransferase
MATKKTRLDQIIVDRGLADSKTRAQALVMAGHVYIGDAKAQKPGQQIAENAEISVRGSDHPWVSRGGIKLAHALEAFAIDVTDHVDSGTNQLAWKLRQDPRVIVHEQTSARILTDAHINEPIDLIVCDASFIGLAKVLERPLSFAKSKAQLIALIKPQFEAGREEVGKGGVVRDADVHTRVCDEVKTWLTSQNWTVHGLTTSPITGPQGNVEFLIWAQNA